MGAINILLVDDDIVMLDIIAGILENYSCKISKVQTVEQALAKIDNAPFDLVITDLQLGCESGIELVNIIKKKNSAPKVFVMTGNYDVKLAIQSFRLGADDYLLKPFSADILLNRMHQNGFAQPGRGCKTFSTRYSANGCQKNLQ